MINNNTQKLGRRQTCTRNKWQKKFIKNCKKRLKIIKRFGLDRLNVRHGMTFVVNWRYTNKD